MAERLTDKNYEAINKCGEFSSCYSCRKEVCYITQICEKLGKLEDILEKYDLEVEELDERIHNGAFNYIDKLKAETDRDTWKRACELACREAPLHCPNPPEYYNAQDEYGSDEPYYIQESACEFSDDAERCLECQINYFYQQAKKDGDDE